MGGRKQVMKGKRRSTASAKILSLPRDMLVSILASVASSSVKDLFNAKLA